MNDWLVNWVISLLCHLKWHLTPSAGHRLLRYMSHRGRIVYWYLQQCHQRIPLWPSSVSSHPDRVVKIMITENRTILESSFMSQALHRLGASEVPQEPNTQVTIININLFGGGTWVSWMNHHHVGCEEETRHPHRGALLSLFAPLTGQAAQFLVLWLLRAMMGPQMEITMTPCIVHTTAAGLA